MFSINLDSFQVRKIRKSLGVTIRGGKDYVVKNEIMDIRFI